MVRLLAVALVVALPAAGALGAPAGENGRFTLRGKVVRVPDADTIHVRLQSGRREVVRLIGVDAPESTQCFAAATTARGRALASGKRVRLLGDPTQPTRDRLDRLLAYVVFEKGGDYGRLLLVGGHAEVVVGNPPFQRVTDYRRAEAQARSAGRGLWTRCRARADLSVTIADVPDPVARGADLTYTITAANGGPTPARSTVISSELDPGVQFVLAVVSGGRCDRRDSVVECAVAAELAPGASVAATIVVRPVAAGSVANAVQVRSATVDPNVANNSVRATTTVS